MLSTELKEVYSNYSDTRKLIETLEFTHPSFVKVYYLVRDVQNHDLIIDINGVATVKTFSSWNFNAVLPEVGGSQQDLNIVLDNVDNIFTSVLEKPLGSNIPTKMTYRVFIEGDLVQQNSDIVLDIVGCSVTSNSISLRASRPDLYKKKFPSGLKSVIGEQFPAIHQ